MVIRSPNRFLLGAGIVAIFAGFVGGDFQGLTFSFPPLTVTIRWALILFGLALCILSFFVGSRPTQRSQPRDEELIDGPKPAPVDPPVSRVEYVRRYDGGDDLVEAVKEAIGSVGGPVVLWGAGGVGKTTIAAQVAREWKSESEGIVVYVSAEAHPGFHEGRLLDEIAGQTGHPELRPLAFQAKEDAIRALAESGDHLVILDGLEVVSDAHRKICLEVLDRLPSPSLVVSRERPLSGRVFQVRGMQDHEADVFVKRLIGVSHNRRTFADLDLRALVRAGDANAMAIEWIIAQIDLGQEPDRVLDDVSRGRGSAAERIFEHSFSLPRMGDDEYLVILALSLFSPNASREALATVAGFNADLARLNEAVERLAALKLVESVEEGQRLAVSGLTRSFAKERAEGHQTARDLRERYIHWYHTFVEGLE